MFEPRRYLTADSASYGGLVENSGLNVEKATLEECQKALVILAKKNHAPNKQLTVKEQGDYIHVTLTPAEAAMAVGLHDNQQHDAFFLGLLAGHAPKVQEDEFHSFTPDVVFANVTDLATAINKLAIREHDAKVIQQITAIQEGLSI